MATLVEDRQAITSAEVQSVAGQQFLCLELDKAENHQCKSLTGILANTSKRMECSEIAVTTQGTDCDLIELV